MATKKTSGGNRKRSTSSTTKRGTTQASMRNVTRNVPLRQPNKSDSMGYKLFYGLVTLLIVGCVFAWQNGYLDRFLVGTPLEQYAMGTGETGSGDVDTTALGDGTADFQSIDWHWNEEESPNYYKVIGKAVIDYDIKPGTIEYAGIDNLGRTLRANGCITYQMVADSAGWRQDFSSDAKKIPGMDANKQVTIYYSDGTKTDKVWALNKSHLIADGLGSESSRRAAVAATRTENVGESAGGALFFENMAINWLKEHQNSDEYMWYSAIPIYNGDELLPRATIINMKSSDGEIDLQGIRYNTMLYYDLNYYTGELTYTGK